MPFFLAAKVGFPFDSFSARMMSCFSASCTVRSFCVSNRAASAAACAAPLPRTFGGRSRRMILSPRQSTTACSIEDRKSTRLNSSHGYISYAVFCLKKKKQQKKEEDESRQL